MKNLKKWILRGILAFVAFLILIVVILFFSLNSLIRVGVERGGNYATGQTTTLDSADLTFSSGTLALNALSINNPSGYSVPKFLTLKNCSVAVQSSSLLSHTVLVNEIDIDGLELSLEQNGLKSNLSEILDVVQKQTSAASGTNNASSAPGKELKISLIKLTNTKVQVKAVVGTTLDLGPIEIKDPTNPDGRPMKIADVVGKVLLRVAQQVVNNPQLPGVFKDGLQNVHQMVGNVDNVLQEESKDLNNKAQEVKDLGGLFGHDKKK